MRHLTLATLVAATTLAATPAAAVTITASAPGVRFSGVAGAEREGFGGGSGLPHRPGFVIHFSS